MSAVDRLADDALRFGLEGEDDQGLGALAGGLPQRGQEPSLPGRRGDADQPSLPGRREGVRETPSPGVGAIQQAQVVEAPLARHAGKDGSLPGVGSGGPEQEVSVVRRAQHGRARRVAHGGNPGRADHARCDRERAGARVRAHDGVHAFGFDEPPRRRHRRLRIGLRVADRSRHRQAEHAAGRVDVRDRKVEAPSSVVVGLRRAAAEVHEQTDLEGFRRFRPGGDKRHAGAGQQGHRTGED